MPFDENHDHLVDTFVQTIHQTYEKLCYTPQNSQWTILASFILSDASSSITRTKVISLATGTKCLPANKLSTRGEIVHDSHAEVLARRCAVRWLIEEIKRLQYPNAYSEWLIKVGRTTQYAFRPGVELNLYVSTLPCGDASMRYLAANQDEKMATLKNSTDFSALDDKAPSRGRDNYARLGVLRTKPGRADSPHTSCMSCSDKIARWNVLGIQGALVARFFSNPLYIDNIIIGEVPRELADVIQEDCRRAFFGRLESLTKLPSSYHLQQPRIYFTNRPFVHSQTALISKSSCVESLCWNANLVSPEILINGLKRGVSPKHRYREKARPLVSRIALLQLSDLGTRVDNGEGDVETYTYYDIKQSALEYQEARSRLLGTEGPFSGWIMTGEWWQKFNRNGEEASQNTQ